ncbi:MAG: hypothetical protein ACYSWP_04605 [Planctomycetota bacterium]|jgi:hypothetical protein
MTRRCSICKKKKDESEFYPQSQETPYLRSECKICAKKASKRYYDKNRKKVLETARKRYARKKVAAAK